MTTAAQPFAQPFAQHSAQHDYATTGPHRWRHVAVQHTCLGNGCLGNGCLGNGCLGNGCLGNGCLDKDGGGRARRRPVTLAKGPQTKFFQPTSRNSPYSTNLIHSRA